MTFRGPGEHTSASAADGFAYDVFVVHADAPAGEAFVNGQLLAKLALDLVPGAVHRRGR